MKTKDNIVLKAASDEWLTDQPELTSVPADGDLLHIVDVSDVSPSPDGRSKKITYAQLKSGIGGGVTPFSIGIPNGATGQQTVITIVDSPVLFTIGYIVTTAQLNINNNNIAASGIFLQANLFLRASSSSGGVPTSDNYPNLPNTEITLPPGTGALLSVVQLFNKNDSQEVILEVNETAQKTYHFEFTAFLGVSGVIIRGEYEVFDLS